ncbi:MAG: phosphopentomutase [Christensenellales bacterium]|jgi:phosphopentomutase
MNYKNAAIIVMDGAGVGALPDAEAFGDAGANTLGHLLEHFDLNLPNLEKMGLCHALGHFGAKIAFAAGKSAEKSAGKDTTTGHWEIAGLIADRPFPTYPDGFPPEVTEPFIAAIGRDILGNVPASGTEIIRQLGQEHMDTGKPIVYTSADSVFQLAASEQIVPLETLYEWCRAARKILDGEHRVSRVIARPFVKAKEAFVRTENRKDFSVEPFGDTILDALKKKGIPVVGVGKISDIFAGRGLTQSFPVHGNDAIMDKTMELIENGQEGLIFANLVDFDMLYGHRRDPQGYAGALERLDARLGRLLEAAREDSLILITADHGCDPYAPGTDHTREYVPVLFWGGGLKKGVNLGVRETFADMGATVYEALTGEDWSVGKSMLREIVR